MQMAEPQCYIGESLWAEKSKNLAGILTHACNAQDQRSREEGASPSIHLLPLKQTWRRASQLALWRITAKMLILSVR
jgi:hypothetical protein